jgi:hypothetical protein
MALKPTLRLSMRDANRYADCRGFEGPMVYRCHPASRWTTFSRYDHAVMRCALCKSDLGYIHGHAACVRSGCPMYGVNQAECCSGETAENGPLTVEVAGSGLPAGAPSDLAKKTA